MAQQQAGWYPLPDGSQRYWDGEGWTEKIQTPPGSLVQSFTGPQVTVDPRAEPPTGAWYKDRRIIISAIVLLLVIGFAVLG